MEYTFASLCVFTIIIFFASYTISENPPYSSFARDATLAPPTTSDYDYIIIGGGTAGCALAATLSQGAKVLVLERGDLPYGIPSVNVINGFIDSLANTAPTSPSQTFVSTDGVINQRGRVLGGGSALNAGFFTRASAEYINKTGFDPLLVNASYVWAQNKVANMPRELQWATAVRDGLLDAGVLPNNGFTFEHVTGTKFGGTIFDVNGRRHTAADLLEYAEPSNITVYLNATVHQITFRNDEHLSAQGVVYVDRIGNTHTATLNEGSSMNEVILSAGTLGSPQMMMLSGIGPSEHLIRHGIRVVLDQPMVGQGMADNPMNIILVPTSQPVEIALVEVVGITTFGSYVESASAHFNFPMAYNYAYQMGRFAGQETNIDQLIASIEQQFDLDLTGLNVGMILEKVMGPYSSGTLELVTTSPYDNPSVTFNYFQDPRDLQRCVEGMGTLINVLESRAMTAFRNPYLSIEQLLGLIVALPLNVRPHNATDPLNLEQFCRDTVMTIWHYHGGCQVGSVVDRNYRVMGVNSLRIIDSSTLLESPGTNPQATMMMLGRYMGLTILRERSTSGNK